MIPGAKELLNIETGDYTMKKIALSLVALTALTGAAFANDRAEEGTVASRNVSAMNTETVGASVVSSAAFETSDFLMMKRYGIESNDGNGNK